MCGTLIETEARRILNKGMYVAQKEMALRLLKRGKQTVEEIAEDTGLCVVEVERLRGFIKCRVIRTKIHLEKNNLPKESYTDKANAERK